MEQVKFDILITTKNRKQDLCFTLNEIKYLYNNKNVQCVVYDDGSTDGTYDFILSNFPEVKIKKNEISKGLIYCRNKMLNESTADYSISLDDDAHFITKNPLELITNYFNNNPNCGLIAFRIFWSKQLPISTDCSEKPERVKGFVGCAHVWRMNAWREIPNYPEWFIFYGEEQFAAFQLFKKNIEIHYFPEVLVNHRVDIISRIKHSDYQQRQRRSLRSGWYLYLLFYPLIKIPKLFLYTFWMQIKLKTFKGNFKATLAIFQAIGDVILNFPKIIFKKYRLSNQEFEQYQKLPETKLYWTNNK